MAKKVLKIVLVGIFLTLFHTHPGFTQTDAELKALRKDIETLKQGLSQQRSPTGWQSQRLLLQDHLVHTHNHTPPPGRGKSGQLLTLSANDKLSDDEERGKAARLGTAA